MGDLDVILYAAVLILIPTVIYYWVKVRGGYKIRIIIWEKRANGYIKRYDKGKRVKLTNGESWYQLKRLKLRIKPPPLEDMNIVEGGITEVELVSPMPGQFQSVRFEDGVLKPIDSEIEFWRSVEVEKEQLRWNKGGFLEKYGWVMAICMIMIVFGITMYMVYDGIQKVAASNAGVSEQNAKVLQSIEKLISTGKITIGGDETPPPSNIPPY